MSENPKSPRNAGMGGVLFLCCAAATVAGVAGDFLNAQDTAFWLGAETGGAAAIGAGAAAFAVIAGIAARLLLARRAEDAKGGRRARTDA